MSFDKAFQLSTYLLLTTGFLAIVAVDGVGTATTLVYLGALVFTWFLFPKRISGKKQVALVIVLVAVYGADGLIVSDWGGASVRLLLALSLLKSATRNSGKDYLQIHLISFALLLVAATFAPSISYLAISIAFLFLSILTLILFENHQGYRENANAPFSLVSNVWIALAITGLILLLAIPIFVAIPRGSVGLLGGERVNLAGFSDSVRLGEIGRILDDQQVVMRVKVNRPVNSLPLDLKWRGIALEYFDGATWTHKGRSNQRVDGDSEGRFLLARNRRQDENLLEQVFLVEPFSDVIFASPELIQVSGLGSGSVRVWQDSNDSVSIQPVPRQPQRYFVHSDLLSRSRKLNRIRTATGIDESLRPYLQLPALDVRLQELAREISGAKAAPIETALLVETYLRENFDYSLANLAAGSQDPLAAFLFQTRAGHCEYFASAQAILLRILGIPTRIVNGFRRGEYNEWGAYFIVRASDAHSWVEAYFPGAGWTEFDPTPPATPENSFRLLRTFSRMMDSVEVLWGEVVTFDRFKQAGFFQLLRNKIERNWAQVLEGYRMILEHGRGDPSSVMKWMWSLRLELSICTFFVLAAAVLYWVRTRLVRMWRRTTRKGDETEFARDYYLEMLDLLREKGFVKSRFETPAEFGLRVSSRMGTELPSRITESYYETRFGGILLDTRQLADVYSLLNQLRHSD